MFLFFVVIFTDLANPASPMKLMVKWSW